MKKRESQRASVATLAKPQSAAPEFLGSTIKTAADWKSGSGDIYFADSRQVEHMLLNPASTTQAEWLSQLSIETPQDGWVADFVAPPFGVKRSTGIYTGWLPNSTHRIYEDEIARGEQPREIEMQAAQYTYRLHEYALANRVYQEDLEDALSPLDLYANAARFLRNAHRLAREARVLNTAFNPAVVPGVVGSNWAVAAGVPITDIENGMDAIFNATQTEATDIIIPRPVIWQMMRTNQWLGRFGGLGSGIAEAYTNVATGLETLGLRVHISRVCGLTTNENGASDPNLFANLIGRQILLFHGEPRPTTKTRMFMYSPYRTRDEWVAGEWGHEVKTRSSYMQIYSHITELMVDPFCGYRITGI